MEDVLEKWCLQELPLTDGEKAAQGKASGSGELQACKDGCYKEGKPRREEEWK